MGRQIQRLFWMPGFAIVPTKPQAAKEEPEVPSRGSPHVQVFIVKGIWSGLCLSRTLLKAISF